MEIIFDNIKFTYEGSNEETIKGLSAHLKKNSINAIIGENGSGKTTLIQTINGLIIPDIGEIRIDDFRVKKGIKDYKDLRFNVGMVFQLPEEQIFNLTVEDEIGYTLDYYNYRQDEKEKHILDALKMVGLNKDYLSKNPLSLSQGEKRKVAIATVLAFNPKVIIFDEPTIGLDYKTKENLIKIIRLLKNRFHKTIIIVSHDVDLVHKLSDYICILSNGKIVKSGSKYEIFTDSNLLKKYHIKVPKIIEFEKLVLEKKKIKLGYRDDINDLLKDIYRNAK